MTDRSSGESLRPIAGVMTLVSLFYGLFLWLRINQFGVLWFVHFGNHFLRSTHSSVVGTNLPAQSTLGYDGQYYYAIAADPAHAHNYLPQGNAGYLYSRPFYPFLSRVVSGGSLSALPYGMLIVNVVAILAGTLVVCLWLRRRGVSPWFALLYGLWPGMVYATFRDLSEPLAFALVAVGVFVFDAASTRRIVAAAVILALALLTRETVFPFVVAVSATLLLADRRRGRNAPNRWTSIHTWGRAAAMLIACSVPLVAWRLTISAWLARSTQEHGSGIGWLIPFDGLARYWHFDSQHWLIVVGVVFPCLVVTAAALWQGVPRRDPVGAGLLFGCVLFFLVFLPKEVYVDYAAAARAAMGVVLASIFCLPAFVAAGSRRLPLFAGAFLLSIGWFMITAAFVGIPSLSLITL